jgi:hypothetical protein
MVYGWVAVTNGVIGREGGRDKRIVNVRDPPSAYLAKGSLSRLSGRRGASERVLSHDVSNQVLGT